MARLAAATAHLEPPFAVLDRDALRANAHDLRRRSHGLPVRVATKSVRCRAVVDEVLAMPGFSGVMAYSLAEALWLVDRGATDVLLAYPSVDSASLRRLAGDEQVAQVVTLMVDDVAQLELMEAAAPAAGLRVCLDVDASLRLGPVHLGVRRSPLRTPEQVRVLAGDVLRRGHALVGLMFYDDQIAGLPDSSPAIRWVKSRSAHDLLRRRREVVDQVREVADVLLVNGGGTGSLHVTGRDPVLTELAAGSGLYGPTLFDSYRGFRPRPALFFVLPVVRRPGPRVATVFGGGYIASGPPGRSRVPTPWWPRGLSLLRAEGAGEVQTPLRSKASGPAVGDRVWFRHAKAGELCERFRQLHVVEGDRLVDVSPTYRGEGQAFG